MSSSNLSSSPLSVPRLSSSPPSWVFSSPSESSVGATRGDDGDDSPAERSTPSGSTSDSENGISIQDFYRSLCQIQIKDGGDDWLMPIMFGWMLKGTQELLTMITAADIPPSRGRVTTRFSEVHGSYSWANKKTPTIYVPGGPRIFTLGDRLSAQDPKPRRYINENGVRMPLYHFEPMFRALMAMDHPYPYDGVDLVTDSNTLRKLLLFCIGDTKVEGFRIDVNLVGKTMFLTLREKHGKPAFKDDEAGGTRLRFPRRLAEQTNSLKDSTSHWHILRYNLGSLNCVVRSEVDSAYHGDDSTRDLKLSCVSHITKSPTTAEQPQVGGGRSTSVIIRGRKTHTSVTAHIATRRRVDTLSELMPQLYLDRTHWLVEVIQKKGVGDNLAVEVTDVNRKFHKWQNSHQTGLQKLVTLLKTIRRFARDNDNRCVVICEHQTRPPRIHIFSSRVAADPLPDDIIAKFWSHIPDFDDDEDDSESDDSHPAVRSRNKTFATGSFLILDDDGSSSSSFDEEDFDELPKDAGQHIPKHSVKLEKATMVLTEEEDVFAYDYGTATKSVGGTVQEKGVAADGDVAGRNDDDDTTRNNLSADTARAMSNDMNGNTSSTILNGEDSPKGPGMVNGGTQGGAVLERGSSSERFLSDDFVDDYDMNDDDEVILLDLDKDAVEGFEEVGEEINEDDDADLEIADSDEEKLLSNSDEEEEDDDEEGEQAPARSATYNRSRSLWVD